LADKVSGKKFTKSFFELMPWVKNLRFILGLAILVFIGLTIYRAYFMKTNTQQVHIANVQPGGTVMIQQQEEEKQEVGLEFYVTSNDAGVSFFKSIGGPWKGSIGAQYDFKDEEIEPRVAASVSF
jgi:hypothetical protein